MPQTCLPKPKYPSGTVVICVSTQGRAKRMPIHLFSPELPPAQGVRGFSVPEGDKPLAILVAREGDLLVGITNQGRALTVPVRDISAGDLLSPPNALDAELRPLEWLTSASIVDPDRMGGEVCVITRRGQVKVWPSAWLLNLKTSALQLGDFGKRDDTPWLLSVRYGQPCLVLASRKGWIVRARRSHLSEEEPIRVRPEEDDTFVGAAWVWEDEPLLLMAASGRGCRSWLHARLEAESRNVAWARVAERGDLVGIAPAPDGDEIFCLTRRGQILRVAASAIPIGGTMADSVQLAALEQDAVVTCTTVWPPRLAPRFGQREPGVTA